MVVVTKADGTKQLFDKEKVIRTCLKMHVSEEEAREVANKVEMKLYEGIPTKKILEMIFFYLKNYRPQIKHQIDLRESISLMRPKPDFENFVGIVLRGQGYEVEPPQLIRGRCVEHEIDGIAKKGTDTIYVEVKHHFQSHTYTGVAVFLETWATFVDLFDGFELHKSPYKFNKALVVCNTKFSDHALQYSKCKGISHIGWNTPQDNSLEKMVWEEKLYPITLIKAMDKRSEEKLGDTGVILLRQLADTDVNDLIRKTRLNRQKLILLKEKARQILED
jgi:hypothetical protein